MTVLSNIYHKSSEIIEYAIKKYKRKDVQKDDILDALCLAINRLIGYEVGFATVPQTEEVDITGLNMAIMVAKTNYVINGFKYI